MLPVRADTPAAPASGSMPSWVWLGAIALVLVLGLFFLRRSKSEPVPAAVTPATPATSVNATGDVAQTSLDATMLSIIPKLNAEHRWGVAQSVLAGLGHQGIDEDALRSAGIDTGGARAGDSKGLTDLVARAASQSPQGLRDGLASYARNVPSFLNSLPPGAASRLKGTLGL